MNYIYSDCRFGKKIIEAGYKVGIIKELKHRHLSLLNYYDYDDYINENLAHFMRTYLVANHDAFCVSCDYIIVDEYESKIERKYAETHPISCGIMYRTDLLMDLGGYNPDMRHRAEEELRARLGDKYRIHHLRIPFYRYRMHSNNKTKDPEYTIWKIN